MTTPGRNVLSLKPTSAETPKHHERLHKVLANGGLGSRRALEERIEHGEVLVNDKPAELGASVQSGDRISLGGRHYIVNQDNREDAKVMIFNKPEGVLVTRDDDQQRPTIYEHLPDVPGNRWIAVGRLDINTTGLLLLTTDGDLANALMHPSTGIAREYLCRIHGEVKTEMLERLTQGVMLEDGEARFDHIEIMSQEHSHSWFRVTLLEGRNREVRRLWDSQGLMVSRLKRIRYGQTTLPRHVRRGHYELMDDTAINDLRKEAKVEALKPRLTVSPLARQRRSQKRFTPKRQAAWSGSYQKEGRELTTFDHLGDKSAGSGQRKRRNKHGYERGKGAINGNRQANGNQTQRGKSGKKRVAPGQELPSVRTWFAGSNHKGKPGKASNNKQSHHGQNRKPSARGFKHKSSSR